MTAPTFMAALRNEMAKMRHLRLIPTAGVMAVGAMGLALLTAATNPEGIAWAVLLANLSLAVPLTAPLLVAVLASRLVDIEHQGSGWLAGATAGMSRGALCRAKWAALALLVLLAVAGTFLGTMVAGALLGASGQLDPERWLRQAGAVAAIHLALLALHVLVSAYVTNQLVGMGFGVLGTVVGANAFGLPAPMRVWLPWGHYAATAQSGYEHGVLVALSPPLLPTGLLALTTAVVFWILTRRLDLQEV